MLKLHKMLVACALSLLSLPGYAQSDPYAQLLRDGLNQAAQGYPAAAIGQFQAAIALNPNNAEAYYELGSILGQTGDFPSAAANLRHALLLNPAMAKAHYSLALTLVGNPQDKEDWPGAVAECQKALQLRPDYPEALNLLGVGLSKQSDFTAAVTALQQAIKGKPSYAQAHFNLALALESTGELADAARQYRAAIAISPLPEASSALGKLLLRMGKPAEAEPFVVRALRDNPDLTDAHYTWARILQAQHHKQQAALEFAIAKDLIERPANGIQAAQMSNQALALAGKGDMAGATALLQKAIALKPDYGVPHFNLGLVLADQGNLAASLLELSKAISLLPGQAAPWFELGRVLELSKDEQGAQNAVAWAAHLDPSNAAIQAERQRLQSSTRLATLPAVGARADTAAGHLAFAQYLSRQGDFQGAVGELLRSLTLQPTREDARRDLAANYTRLGQPRQAELEYRKLQVAFPGHAAPRHPVLPRS